MVLADDASEVGRTIQLSKFVDSLLHPVSDLIQLPDVARAGQDPITICGLALQGAKGFVQIGLRDIGDADGSSSGDKQTGQRKANATGAAGDSDDFAFHHCGIQGQG